MQVMSHDLTLVTGATGLVGNNVVRRLLADGGGIRALVRSGQASREFAGLDVEVFAGDVTDPDSVRRACEGVAAVVHAAGFVQLGRTRLDVHRAINVEGTRNVAAAARQAGAKMVHVSSCDALGVRSRNEPADEETEPNGRLRVPYAITKREAELVVLEAVAAGLDATIVNPGFMLGPWDWKPSSGRMLLEVARGRGWVAPRGYFSVCDVRDVADGIAAALERGQTGRRYILAGTTMRYIDAWRLFAEVTAARRPLMAAGPLVAKLAGWTGDAIGKLTGKEPDVNSGAFALAALPKHYTIARAEQELGYRHRPVRESVEDAWRWFQEFGFVGGNRR
ncbi:MAG: NAD-dependent epimerase/dehydratase family protein [Pirellulales bacterium]